ncbi:hypothetical protein SteCoe_4001 [Stentor coeruleus]|uniref:Calmodulin n=1 Tax=Stentor coeruleus TaxID=5963 RepID=A0A1R2BXQ0_9CILI|nr:hypothetical protein SteCoe_17923 [Stentor coeruleus]OMJ93061.1 hypothetical protein SteCoe_4001 [Stentor coeruleus]
MQGKYSDEDLAEFKESFDLFDTENKGEIEYSKLGTILRSFRSYPWIMEAERVNAKMKAKGRDTIDFDCFMEIFNYDNYDDFDPEVEILEKIRVYDPDNTGLIDRNIFISILKDMDPGITENEVFNSLNNKNCDLVINYKEVIKQLT